VWTPFYLSVEPETALAEYQQTSPILPPGTVVSYQVALSQIVDFTGGYEPSWDPLWQEFACDWRRLVFNDKIEPPQWNGASRRSAHGVGSKPRSTEKPIVLDLIGVRGSRDHRASCRGGDAGRDRIAPDQWTRVLERGGRRHSRGVSRPFPKLDTAIYGIVSMPNGGRPVFTLG
jgi:hypothetical protein